ncbi:sensor histidine kinase [Paenibacillus crassostreae]|uniref:histidine kinase n=1 Tax=Paenibacillus crassostreae TaxID=1763538 RepID=A0A167FCA1_9BACL|nr:ATP-binding protein [Paenibacillus crassostreae]AOZ90832.1 hypothetical protein LPB68_00505 [Paenibacillus crassostreae]OAB76403.1 hypothetical protein PNBC_03030 [Paenibacillus crassostreae]
MRTKTIATIYIVTMLVLFSVVNVSFYNSASNTIIEDQKTDIEDMIDNLKFTFQSAQAGELLFEGSLAEGLRYAAIAAQNELPSKLEDVTNKQLLEVSKKLQIDGITLFKYSEEIDDFVAVKSSIPDEIGLKTGRFTYGLWNVVFKQLMSDKHEATPIENFGENLPNFWAGQYDTTTSDPTKILKWGYYNDGTTDYLINTYISSDSIFKFHEISGIDFHIQKLIENNPFLKEIAILNDKIFQGEWKSPVKGYPIWHSERTVLFGSYEYAVKEDLDLAAQSVSKGESLHFDQIVDGKRVMKSYVPLQLDTNVAKEFNRLIVIATSDVEIIDNMMKEKQEKMLLASFAALAISTIILWTISHFINRQNKISSDIQSMYVDNIDSLFKTIKEYHHDYNNQIFALAGLSSLKKYDAMDDYLKTLTRMNTSLNNIINIHIPAFSGLIQTKLAIASENDIQFEHDFEGFDKVHLSSIKVMDTVRIIGNIIDNAFYAMIDTELTTKKLVMYGTVQKGYMTFRISNNGSKIPKEYLSKIFDHGYSTKSKKNNSGLGLAIVNNIVKKYKGQINVESNEEETTFTVLIPLTNREYKNKD